MGSEEKKPARPRIHVEIVRSTEPLDFDAWAEQYIRLALELRREDRAEVKEAA